MTSALLFGASGISGWSVTRELLRYPTPTTFSKIIALSNRPLDPGAALLDDERLNFAHGVDLTKPVEEVVSKLKEVGGEDVERVTEVFWYAYVHKPDDGDLVATNAQILDTTLRALKEVCPKMRHFIWQTGAKYYGVEYLSSHPDLVAPAPWEETQPRRPEPLYSKIFYYKQLDIIAEYAKDASWSYNDLRPGPIIGYSPTPNAMNLALSVGVYLSIYRAIHGLGATVPLPASLAGAQAVNSESPADDIARVSIFLALKSDSALKGKSFNVADEDSTYERRWPGLAKAWGLVGAPPDTRTSEEDPTARAIEWARSQTDTWHELKEKHGLRIDLEQIDFDFFSVLGMPQDRRMSTKALREAGWNGEPTGIGAYVEAWTLCLVWKALRLKIGTGMSVCWQWRRID
ncbi:unnamed protein product [Peniophora sp. CBMAI 1063]|nr:unnamed protein product [Peniophora sp. CBMAI 1063]